MKKILLIMGILLCFSNIAIADLDFLNDHDYIHINSTCLISNTPQTVEIPIYNGFNLISIPLYPNSPTLNDVFGNNPVSGDVVSKFVSGDGYRSATYYAGYGWWEWESVAPIEPKAGYEYTRQGVNYTLIVNGTYLPKDINCSTYTYFNFKNRIGTNLIRPTRSDIYD